MAPHPGRMQGDHPSTPGRHPDPDDRRTPCRTLQRGRKAADAADEKTNQGRGKDVERKSPKADFSSQLANPAKYAGFALSHRLYDGWQLLTKPDTSFVPKSGHFHLLTTLTDSRQTDRNACYRRYLTSTFKISAPKYVIRA